MASTRRGAELESGGGRELAPLRFDIRAPDGELLDSFAEDELSTFGTGKTWHEASCWGYLATVRDRELRPHVYADAK